MPTKKLKASVLAVSLIILGIILAIALSISFISVRERNAAITSNKSNMAIQLADNGNEKVQQLIRDNLSGRISDIDNFDGTCDDGVINLGLGWKAEIKSGAGNLITDCNASVAAIKSIKSIGTIDDRVQRAIEAEVAVEKSFKPNSDIMLVMDISGSMAEAEVLKEKNAAISLINSLDSGYRVGIIFFHAQIFNYPLTPIENKEDVINFINNFNRGIVPFGTNTGSAIREATSWLVSGPNNRHGANPQSIILVTDGVPSLRGASGHTYDDSVRCPAGSSNRWDITMAGEALAAGTEAKNEEIVIFTIGIGLDDLGARCYEKANEIMLAMASTSINYISIDSFSELKNILDNLVP